MQPWTPPGATITFAVLALTAAEVGAQWTEVGDAPDDLDVCVAQRVEGAGPLTTISGTTSTGVDDFVDAYVIEITDAAAFYATTSVDFDPNAAAVWDTRLFLFDASGGAVLANDDAPGVAGSRSYVSAPGIFPGAVDPTAAPLVNGTYVLAITGWANDPDDAAGTDLFSLDVDFDALFGPDPAAGPFDHWENIHGLAMSGVYTIALQGAGFVDDVVTCPPDINCDGNVDVVDLLLLLGAWGQTDAGAADINDDGNVDVIDLLIMLGAWGPCP